MPTQGAWQTTHVQAVCVTLNQTAPAVIAASHMGTGQGRNHRPSICVAD